MLNVDVGEKNESLIYKKIVSRGRAFKVTDAGGQLEHLERTLVSPHVGPLRTE